MIKHVFFDFNGTLLDDVNLCLDLLNYLLKGQNKETKDIETYKNIFTFPIINYYVTAGLDFKIESFESLAHKFMDKYLKMYVDCKLYPGVFETLDFLKKKGIKIYMLSASKQDILNSQCDYFGLTKYFDEILGTKDIYAKTKEDVANNFMAKCAINEDEAIFIGDTLHDAEVAKIMRVRCYLVSCGHQSKEVLAKSNAIIVDDINVLRDDYNEIFNR